MKILIAMFAMMISISSFAQSSVAKEEMLTVKAKAHSVPLVRHRAQKERDSQIRDREQKCLAEGGQLEVTMKWASHHKVLKRSYTPVSRATVVCHK